ncbi:SGNH/GDSL hydrolase family protein [Leifsonia aquatica]|uniref:GDSL-like protein n=2 Tax=Leifsonia aquatica TaxID=144185 RepID=U2SZY8_LEIAQ|nr:SGNH/GDSL hydrolase family protein [Leifsonia aquatica]ERK70818.1 GDSL-like protein [Leifsonia aquatica ATCC 14665]MBB2966595.1 lysophospholipase L1-like esterase [Leifsonia aquatica]
MFTSYIAIGDSFTEGVGDDLPDGRVRGWADFVALGLAAASPEPVRYANLAIRGRKLGPIVAEQIEPAIAQHPQLVSFNGGGNDIMRPRVAIRDVARILVDAADRVTASGSHMLLLSGANPSAHLPLGGLVRKRGNELAREVRAMLPRDGITFVDNWADEGLEDIRYWSADRLHLNALGHARVASNVLTAFDVPVPEEWGVEEVAAGPGGERSRRTAEYYRRFVLPWIGRRLTGRSSGDGRQAKIAELTVVDPASAQPL